MINTPELAEEFQKVVSKVEGIDNLITKYESSMGADDFADYVVNKPGVYGLLGANLEKRQLMGITMKNSISMSVY